LIYFIFLTCFTFSFHLHVVNVPYSRAEPPLGRSTDIFPKEGVGRYAAVIGRVLAKRPPHRRQTAAPPSPNGPHTLPSLKSKKYEGLMTKTIFFPSLTLTLAGAMLPVSDSLLAVT
jgi:hypothetical protein